ncbi:MAG: ABC transporter substrate-binding protein [Burkholderiaceae bacterium]
MKMKPMSGKRRAVVIAAALSPSISVWAPAAAASYDQGASDSEIRIGHTTAYSGPVSAFGVAGRTLQAFFRMVNDTGGIKGRKVTIISLDDGYSPPKALEQTRRLVESDGVLAIFGVSGSPTNAATQKYLNNLGVPQILIATGASRFNDPKAFPWTMPFWPSYELEQRTYVDYILKVKPDAKIAVLYANDDYGKDHLNGVKAALAAHPGSKAAIVAAEPYETTDATVDSLILKLRSSGADVLISGTTPKFAAQAIRKVHDLNWQPMQFVANASSSIANVMIPAGVDNSVGVMTAGFLKSIGDPATDGDEDVRAYYDFMKKWNQQDSPLDFYAAVSYVNANMLKKVLEACGDDLTRKNLMKQVANIHDVHLPLHLPKVALKTTPDDFAAFRALQLQKFDGKKWVSVD